MSSNQNSSSTKEAYSSAPDLPMSFAQTELWLTTQFSVAHPAAFVSTFSVTIQGDLTINAVQRAIAQLIDRHESLRTRFHGTEQTQTIAAKAIADIIQSDLCELAKDVKDAQLNDIRAQHSQFEFDLNGGPLFKLQWLRISPQDHELLFTVHQLIADTLSIETMAAEFVVLLAAELSGDPAALAPSYDYQQYLSWANEEQDSQTWQQAAQYWREKFVQAPAPLELPINRPRERQSNRPSSRLDRLLPATTMGLLSTTSDHFDVSAAELARFGFVSFLHGLCDQSDLVWACPLPVEPDLQEQTLLAHRTVNLPIRSELALGTSFSDFIQQAKQQMAAAEQHKLMKFSQLLTEIDIDRDPARIPLASIMLETRQTSGQRQLGSLVAEYQIGARSYDNYELSVCFVANPSGIEVQCQYRSDLVDEATVHGWLDRYLHHLEQVLQRADAPLNTIELITPAQREQIQQWNVTEQQHAHTNSLLELIAEQTQRTPQEAAVQDSSRSLSYAELEEQSDKIAQQLIKLGATKGQLIGLCMERSAHMLSSLLAILKTGAAYVPMDASYPHDRLAYMLDTAEVKLLLTESQFLDSLPKGDYQSFLVDVELDNLSAVEAVPLNTKPEAHDIAYVIFTSGSTGKPKGVKVPHAAVANFLQAMAVRPGIHGGDRLLAVTTLSFDIAVLELYLPITVGATTVIASSDDSGNPQRLKALLTSHDINVMQATPSTWRMLLASDWQGRDDFKILTGGEAFPADLLQALTERSAEVWNMYGPTETTVWSTCSRLQSDQPFISIGTPIANTQCYVVDKQLRMVPIGAEGELLIGGLGVTAGYLARPDLTADRFIADPFDASHSDARLYRTGDLVSWTNDGRLNYLGRIDNQVKVRGFRIELGEIETVLSELASIKQCVASVHEARTGDQRLIAYLVPQGSTEPSIVDVRKHLNKQVPDYMIPQHVVILDTIPMTLNGKVDRKSLPPPFAARGSDQAQTAAPHSPAERWIADCWSTLLNEERVSVNDNFFDIGGHSLLAAEFISVVRREKSVEIPLSAMTLQSLSQIAAEYLASNEASAINAKQVSTPSSKSGASGSLFGKLLGLFRPQ